MIKTLITPDVKLGGKMAERGIKIIPASGMLNGEKVYGMEINIYFDRPVQFIVDRRYAEKLVDAIREAFKELDKEGN